MLTHMPDKQHIAFRVSPKALGHLRSHAAERGISLSELGRRILDEWLERRPPQPTDGAQK